MAKRKVSVTVRESFRFYFFTCITSALAVLAASYLFAPCWQQHYAKRNGLYRLRPKPVVHAWSPLSASSWLGKTQSEGIWGCFPKCLSFFRWFLGFFGSVFVEVLLSHRIPCLTAQISSSVLLGRCIYLCCILSRSRLPEQTLLCILSFMFLSCRVIDQTAVGAVVVAEAQHLMEENEYY